MSRRVLILFAHPTIQKSRVNRQMANLVKNLENVTFHDLYEEYPDLNINVSREQELLKLHQVIVFQHPFYWYSTPSILKEWMDLVLEYGFAYGEGGTALEGKLWVHALTTGGLETAYRPQGANRYSLKEFLAPLNQTAYLCGMPFIPPFAVYGSLQLDPEKDIPIVAQEYRRFIELLRDSQNSFKDLPAWDRINPYLGELK